MRITTKQWSWLGATLLLLVFALPANAQRTVTLQLNSATLPDTLNAGDEVQVRGAVDGTGNVTLPDGNVIDWNDNTTIKPGNDGGDYWSTSFQIPDNSELQFKFYADLAEQDGIGGWEDGDNHVLAAGTGDTTLALHYFVKGAGQEYDWRPFESKQDSVGIWFRVFMCTADGLAQQYNPKSTTATIGVRGDDVASGGVLDWGSTDVVLSQESTTDATPGFDLWSGVAHFPADSAGNEIAYKFVYEDAAVGWESSPNRTFTLPTQDSTLAWTYFGNSAPRDCGTEPVTGDVIFSVDLAPLTEIGIFNRARGDTLQVVGSLNGWDWQDRATPKGLMDRFPGTDQFDAVVTVSQVPNTDINYKYIIWFDSLAFANEKGVPPPGRWDVTGSDSLFSPIGWEEPISTQGANRVITYLGAAEQETGVQLFNDILAGNIVSEGTSIDVTFEVDMTPALSAAEPFNPVTDSVFLHVEDPIWQVTQGETGIGFVTFFDQPFTNVSGNTYTGTFTMNGPTYAAIQYKYSYGGKNGSTDEQGGDTATEGRRRTRFVPPNPDGSWPAAHPFPSETYQPEGPLPFETNPVAVGVEAVGGELPVEITLRQNFPNPFNPTTTFEYAISAPQKVELHVYDVIGRRVATLVDGVQPANTYRVTFDARDLASGTYFYRLETDDKVITRSMVLLR